MEYNYVTMCLADISILLPNHMFDNCVPLRQLSSCSVTRPFLSLQRVWLVRLVPYASVHGAIQPHIDD